jgi:hypothetical protein
VSIRISLEQVIGVRIPASQPLSLTSSSSLVRLVGTSLGKHRGVLTHAANGSESLPPSHSRNPGRPSTKH